MQQWSSYFTALKDSVEVMTCKTAKIMNQFIILLLCKANIKHRNMFCSVIS